MILVLNIYEHNKLHTHYLKALLLMHCIVPIIPILFIAIYHYKQ